jgi:hypothetical protein
MKEITIAPTKVEHQDKFFLWAMIILPILSLCAYIFDAYYYYYSLHQPSPPIYEGLLSTIVIVFSYLQYCAPIKSRHLLFAYHLFLWTLVEIGHIGYILSFIHTGKVFSIVVYVGWMICDILFTSGLLYCRVYRRLDYHIEVEHKHIFHFISRLEVILAIFIPIFLNQSFSTTTRDNIAFFLLFDFFSEKYERFSGIWIKSCLYLFVAAVTVSVGSEWLYFSFKDHTLEYTDVAELISGYLCDTLIIMQFFAFHFRPQYLKGIVCEVQAINHSDRPIVAA